jgi:hypothetical protein
MRRAWASALLGLGFVACQTITEEMPTRPTPNDALNLPVLVVPAPPPGAPAPEPPAPAPTPAPGHPAPTPEPPNPEPPPDGGGDFPDNNAPVAKLGAKIYFVEDGGVAIAYPPAPVGSRIHLDVTPKDAANKPTRARGTIRWTFSRTDIVKIGNTDGNYNPTLTAKAPGDLVAYAEVDGVRSNNVDIIIR